MRSGGAGSPLLGSSLRLSGLPAAHAGEPVQAAGSGAGAQGRGLGPPGRARAGIPLPACRTLPREQSVPVASVPMGTPASCGRPAWRAAGWREEPPLWPSPSPERPPGWLHLPGLCPTTPVGRERTRLLGFEGPRDPWADAPRILQGGARLLAAAPAHLLGLATGRPWCSDHSPPQGETCSPHVSGQRSLPGVGASPGLLPESGFRADAPGAPAFLPPARSSAFWRFVRGLSLPTPSTAPQAPAGRAE